MYRIWTPIGYLTVVKADGSYNVGAKYIAKLWRTRTGAEKAAKRVRKLFSAKTLSKKALVIQECEETTRFNLRDYSLVEEK
jgi:hypothetical protein